MIIDLLFLISAIYGLYIGFSRGIIKTVFTILSVLFGVIIAFRFSPTVTEMLETAFDTDNPLMFIAGFLLTLVLTMIFIRTFARVLENGLKTANINLFNQAAGALLTAAFTTLIFSFLLRFGNMARLVNEDTKRESFTYSLLEKYPDSAIRLLKKAQPTFKQFWDRSMEFIDKMNDYRVERSDSEPSIYDIDDEGNRTSRN